MARASYLPTASPEAVGLSSSRLRQAMEVLRAEVEGGPNPRGRIRHRTAWEARASRGGRLSRQASRRADGHRRDIPAGIDDQADRLRRRDDVGRGRQAVFRRSCLRVSAAIRRHEGRCRDARFSHWSRNARVAAGLDPCDSAGRAASYGWYGQSRAPAGHTGSTAIH